MLTRDRVELPADLKRLAYRTLGAAYRVHTALGPSMKEGIYRRCLHHALTNDDIRAVLNEERDVEFEGLMLPRALRLDVLVEDQIVLELKANPNTLPVWEAQLLSYLEHGDYPLGYVVNFHVAHLRRGIRPMINRDHFPPSERPVHPVHPVQLGP